MVVVRKDMQDVKKPQVESNGVRLGVKITSTRRLKQFSVWVVAKVCRTEAQFHIDLDLQWSNKHTLQHNTNSVRGML